MKKIVSILTAAAIVLPQFSTFRVFAENNEIVQSAVLSETTDVVTSIIAQATGDTTDIDTSMLYSDESVEEFAVTTADADGNLISHYKVDVADLVTVDTVNASAVEIVPVFRYEEIGSLVSEKTLKSDVENGRYNFTFKKARTERSDIYINGKMVLNNADQAGYNRSISEGSQINVNDIVIDDGSVRISMVDTRKDEHATMSWCEFYKAPEIVNRKTKVFVIGDSLVATYYGSENKQYKGQFGWGEVIGNFLNDNAEVWNLAQAGNYATILEETAYPGVISNGEAGDYFIIESGYNDTKYNDADTTRESVERMVNGAKEKGMIPVVVSPNASMKKCEGTDAYFTCTNDYAESVHFADAMRQAAENTDAYFVDLSKGSYDFYNNNYGDETSVIENTYYFPSEPDVLHHNYLGAMLCARTVVQGMYELGVSDIVNTDFEFTYKDSQNAAITLAVGEDREPVREVPEATEVPQGTVWDFSEYTTSVGAVQDPKTTTYAEIDSYNGLRIYLAVNNVKDYVDTAGVHFGGARGSNPDDGSSGRYLTYTPEVSGTLYVTGYAASNKTNRWGIVEGEEGNFIGDESSTNNETDTVTVQKLCTVGTTYYVYGRDGGMTVTRVQFIPDETGPIETEVPTSTPEPTETAAPTSTPKATEAPTVTVAPTSTPDVTAEPEDGIKADISLDEDEYKISIDAGDLVGVIAVAAYDNGRLVTMKTTDYNGKEIITELPASVEADKIKLMLWDGIEGMNPLCESFELHESDWEVSENEAEVVSLAGEWGLKLCEYSDGIVTDDTCILPGTLSENGKGKKNSSADKTKLSLKYTYTGSAVYEKKVNIPAEWADKSVTLTLERTKNTRVWVNGVEQTSYSTNDSLAAPHEYYLSGLKFGEENAITVEVTNGEYDLFRVKTHMLTDETQTDWNGIIGELALKATDKIYIKDVMVYPDAANKTAKVKVVIKNEISKSANGNIAISASSYNHDGDAHVVPAISESVLIGTGETTIEYTYDMGDDVKLWSEFHPSLYRMTVSLDMENGAKNDYTETFGMRDFGTDNGQFTINGKATFLRGEANSAVFPLTGYPFMTKEQWKDFFGKAQAMGINFFRFHSWTPPMAAFEAADEMGIYMQPEMYGFGGTPTGFDTLYGKEGERILEYFASNPSFVMMTLGNEMTTSDSATKTAIKSYCEKLKDIDSTRLYAEGTNNNLSVSQLNPDDEFWTTAKVGMDGNEEHVRLSFAWNNAADGGRLEGEQPNSCQDFNKAMESLNSDIPVMGHETGQYQVYPNFEKEIPKYESGVFAPRNLSSFKDKMEDKGLLEMNEIFSRVTARTSAIQYRADIEAALKTQKFGGYQLLSIQDFPGQNTALVGILDSFMDDKDGGFTSEEYKSFNSPVTTLARIPKYMYNADENFSAEAVITNYSEDDLADISAKWTIKLEDGNVLKEGTLPVTTAKQGDATSLGNISESGLFSSITKAQKLTLEVSAAGNTNSYSLWVYPVETMSVSEDVLVADAYTKEVRDTLAAGGKVVMLPTPNETNLPGSVSVRWTNDYWSSMFHGRVAGAATTMGLYVEEDHAVFENFPTEYFGDYQWYNLMKNSRAIVLDNAPAELVPMAWNIDHMAYSRKLGSIFEAKVGEGKLLVCTMDILNQMENYPEVRQMYNSLVEYASSDDFNPTVELTTDYLRTIFKQVITSTGEVSAYDTISGFDYSYSQTKGELKSQNGSDESGNEITGAVDGISAGDMLRYDNLNFSGDGSVKLNITAANGASEAANIEVYLGSDKGDKLCDLTFDVTDGWDKFVTCEYEIPHVWGNKNILFKFTNANICLGSISFEQTEESYRNPYNVIDPSNTSAGAVEFTSLGGSHETEQLTVKIIDGVSVTIPNCDFGFEGSSKLIIGGSIINDTTELAVDIVYSDNGVEKRIPVIFKMGEGEEYTVMSGTTGEYTFYRNTIELGETIKGVQDLSIEFPPGTLFEFSDIAFVDSAKEAKVWDMTKAVTAKTTFDALENRTFVYNGLTIVGGGASDYLDTSVGMHYNGKTSVSGGVANRYISYMPKTDGVMKITAKRAFSNGALYVSEAADTSNGRAIENLTNNSSWATGEVVLSAYTTYYFYCNKTGMEIKNMEFIPD